jgi:hypothetical protein
MTHNTVQVPIERLQLPAFVEYHGKVYRAWHRLPLVKPGGFVLDATDTHLNRHALLYASEGAIVLKVVG